MAQMHAQNVECARDMIRGRIGSMKPKIAVILGSGLGGLTEKLQYTITIPYKTLPGFPVLTVQGHAGEIVAGSLNGVDILAFRGRKHFYETDDAYPTKTMIRTIKALGVETLFLTNAAGSLQEHIKVGELMMITDHINYMGYNPLVGPNDEDFGPRFPPLTDAWDHALNKKLKDAALKSGVTLHDGVYVAFRGPSFETPAEIRMAKMMGGSTVGMSSVPECIIARHCGLKVIGCSCITNMGAGLSDEKLSHEMTLENAKRGAVNFEKLISEFVKSA